MLKLEGQVRIWKNKELLFEGKNLVVDSGLDLVAKLVAGTGTVLSHMAIGNSGGASLGTMTALQGSELERVALSSTTVNSNTIAYVATFGSAISVTVTVREVGLFNASSGGEMLCRFICSGFDLSAGESAEVEWSMTIQEST